MTGSPGWPDPAEVKLGTMELRIRMRSLDGHAQVVLELVRISRGAREVAPVLAIPARQCAALGDALLKFAAAIPDRANAGGAERAL